MKRLLVLFFVLLAIACHSVVASEIVNTKGDSSATEKNGTKKPKWKSNIEFGYVATSGNTKTTTVNSGIGIIYEVAHWRHSLDIKSIFGSAENESTSMVDTNAERYFIQAKTDYKYSETSYAFVLGNYDKDRFSDNDYQISSSVGRGFRLSLSDHSKLDLEVGAGYRSTKKRAVFPLSSETIEEVIFRLATKYVWDISQNSRFEQKLSSDIGNDSTVTKFYTGLSANIIDNLALKLSLTATHQSQVRGDIKKLDTISAFTLVYSF